MPCRFTELRHAHLQSPVAALVGAATADRYGRVRGGERMNGAPVLSPPCSTALRRRNFLTAAGAAVAVLAPGMRPARAQSERQRRIAIMTSVIPGDLISEIGGDHGSRLLSSALRRLGYLDGRNLVIERYSAEGQSARLSTLARDPEVTREISMGCSNVLTNGSIKSGQAVAYIVLGWSDECRKRRPELL